MKVVLALMFAMCGFLSVVLSGSYLGLLFAAIGLGGGAFMLGYSFGLDAGQER